MFSKIPPNIMANAHFSLLTLNTFGLPLYLGLRRIGGLCHELNRLSPTILCLQEIQQSTYIHTYKKHLRNYPFFAFQPGRFSPLGGLLCAARFPIINYEFLPFPQRGRLWSIGFADWALCKGILKIEINVDGNRIIVFNTHLHANYHGKWDISSELARIQLSQVNYLVEMALQQPEDALLILCGDFNFHRITFLYEELIRKSSFIDPLMKDERGTYIPFPLTPSSWALPIDFIFYRLFQSTNLSVNADILTIEDTRKHFSFQRFLTDHKALLFNVDFHS